MFMVTYASIAGPKDLKRTTNKNNKKIQLELARKLCRSLKAIFCPRKMFNRAFRKRQNVV